MKHGYAPSPRPNYGLLCQKLIEERHGELVHITLTTGLASCFPCCVDANVECSQGAAEHRTAGGEHQELPQGELEGFAAHGSISRRPILRCWRKAESGNNDVRGADYLSRPGSLARILLISFINRYR